MFPGPSFLYIHGSLPRLGITILSRLKQRYRNASKPLHQTAEARQNPDAAQRGQAPDSRELNWHDLLSMAGSGHANMSFLAAHVLLCLEPIAALLGWKMGRRWIIRLLQGDVAQEPVAGRKQGFREEHGHSD